MRALCVDYNNYTPKKYQNNVTKLVFGWIGGNHNYKLLDSIIPILDTLSYSYDFKLVVIGGDVYKKDVNFEIEFFPWSLDTEIENLYKSFSFY